MHSSTSILIDSSPGSLYNLISLSKKRIDLSRAYSDALDKGNFETGVVKFNLER